MEAGLVADWAAVGLEPPGLHDARHHCLTHWGRVWDIGRLHRRRGTPTSASRSAICTSPGRDAEDAARFDAYLGAV
jgi:hypothetical protein